MTMINQAHVEAICSATYLQNYLDCLDTLPDELQRILTQIREVDVRLTALEKDTAPFEEVFVKLKDDEPPDTKFVAQLQRMLLRMQEFEDEKIQLSNSLMEFIEIRTKQLEADHENLDPANHMVTDGPPTRSTNSNSKKNGNGDTKPSAAVLSSTSVQSIDSSKDIHKQADQKPTTCSAKKRKQKVTESQTTSNKSTSGNSRTTHNSSYNQHNSSATVTNNSKDDTPAKKHTLAAVSREEPKSASRLPAKRKRRSRIGAHSKSSSKEVAKQPSPEPEEPTYCLCNQISYGEMIGCDNDACPIEWFHFNCVNLNTKPKGKWYCPKCRGDKPTLMRRGADKVK